MKKKVDTSGKRSAGTARRRVFMPNAATRRRARVLVVGDVMLDRYLFGEVSRI